MSIFAILSACADDQGLKSPAPVCSPAALEITVPRETAFEEPAECGIYFDPVVLGSRKNDARVRVFALGRRVDVQEGESEQSFYNTVSCMAKSASAYFRKDVPNLLVYEEYTGLPLVFVGDKGNQARKQSTLLAAATQFATVANKDRFSEISKSHSSESLEARIISILTAHGWPSFARTFSAVAKKYGVPLMATTLVPRFDPVTLEPDKSDIRVTNTTVLFDAEGKIQFRWDKVNLVPFEKDNHIFPGTLEDLGECEYAGYHWGSGISLDAFVPTFLQRMNDLGVQVLVQPDANDSHWASIGGAGFWQPEEWLGSVIYSVQDDYPSILYNVNPMMTGGFLDLAFDGQTAITSKSDSRNRRDVNYIGNFPLDRYPIGPRPTQPWMGPFPGGGFIVLGPWIYQDPDFPAVCPGVDFDCVGLDRIPQLPESLRNLRRDDADPLGTLHQRLIEDVKNRDSLPLPYLESLVFADL